jgi:ferredoxin
MRVTVDKHVCIGAGQCVMSAPGVFDQDDDEGTVVLLEETPVRTTWDAVRKAADRCPSGAIRVDE